MTFIDDRDARVKFKKNAKKFMETDSDIYGFENSPADPVVPDEHRFFNGFKFQTQEKDLPPSKPIVLRHIADIVAEQREPEWLIHKALEANVLAVLVGPRGTYKSFLALDWSMRMAIAGHAGVMLSGEGGGLDRRVSAWMNQNCESTDIRDVPLRALERPVNLNSKDEMKALRTAISGLPAVPKFIVVDTFSKFSAGLDENDNSEVAAFLSRLSELREELHCTILLVAHTGHGDSTRPRGASSLMCNPDAEYIVNRPEPGGMIVTVTRDRFKDSPSLPPLAYEAKVIDLGRLDRYGEPVTSLALVSTDSPQLSVSAKGRGKNQGKVVVALKEWHRSHPDETHISSIDIRAICIAQDLVRQRIPEVLKSLVGQEILTSAVGGYAVHAENL